MLGDFFELLQRKAPATVAVDLLEQGHQRLPVADVPHLLLHHEGLAVRARYPQRPVEEGARDDIPGRDAEEEDVECENELEPSAGLGQGVGHLAPVRAAGRGLQECVHGAANGSELINQDVAVLTLDLVADNCLREALHDQQRKDVENENEQHQTPKQAQHRADDTVDHHPQLLEEAQGADDAQHLGELEDSQAPQVGDVQATAPPLPRGLHIDHQDGFAQGESDQHHVEHVPHHVV
mmetsp:Transcript_107708/g.310103  ORF Transcript_107708/g.310103 Transcript_107708/m.310103 type:complete len:237 (-) Transcript_107708:777-1487(-)